MIRRMRRMNEAMDKMVKTSKRPRMLLDQYDEYELKLVAHYQNSQYSVFLYSGINPDYPEDGLSFNLLGIGEVDSRDGYVMEFDTDMTYAVEKVLNSIVKDIDNGATMDDILSDYKRENARFNDYTPVGFKMNESVGRPRGRRLSESYNRRMLNESIDNITKADIREVGLKYEGKQYIISLIYEVLDNNENVCKFDIAGINNPETLYASLPTIKAKVESALLQSSRNKFNFVF